MTLFVSKKARYLILARHRSLVAYLAQVKNVKNYPTHSDCVLSWVWVFWTPLTQFGGVFMNLPVNSVAVKESIFQGKKYLTKMVLNFSEMDFGYI